MILLMANFCCIFRSGSIKSQNKSGRVLRYTCRTGKMFKFLVLFLFFFFFSLSCEKGVLEKKKMDTFEKMENERKRKRKWTVKAADLLVYNQITLGCVRWSCLQHDKSYSGFNFFLHVGLPLGFQEDPFFAFCVPWSPAEAIRRGG